MNYYKNTTNDFCWMSHLPRVLWPPAVGNGFKHSAQIPVLVSQTLIALFLSSAVRPCLSARSPLTGLHQCQGERILPVIPIKCIKTRTGCRGCGPETGSVIVEAQAVSCVPGDHRLCSVNEKDTLPPSRQKEVVEMEWESSCFRIVKQDAGGSGNCNVRSSTWCIFRENWTCFLFP
jgi:hypothetical protein